MPNPKDLVLAFYNSDAWKNTETLKHYLHPKYQQFWHSPNGFIHYNFQQVIDHGKDLKAAFTTVKFNISHCIAKNNQVVLRYYVSTTSTKNPKIAAVHSHFIAIWEVKDDKLYRCYEVSAKDDASLASIESYNL